MSKNAKIIPDTTYPGMYRINYPDTGLSDMVNSTRANDAALRFNATLERDKSPSQARRKPLRKRK